MPTREELQRLSLRELEAIEANFRNGRELCRAAGEVKNFLLRQQAAHSFEQFQAGTAKFRELAEGLRKIAANLPSDPVAQVAKTIDTIIVDIGDLALQQAGIVPDPDRGVAEPDPAAPPPAAPPAPPPPPAGGDAAPGPTTTLASKKFADLEQEYVDLFDSARILPERQEKVKALADVLTLNRPRYERVGKPLGIPWHVLAVIHAMEKPSFQAHLHNGDPLDARTVHEPIGRPKKLPASGAFPYTWEESAEDALRRRKLDKIAAGSGGWSLARTLHALEGYNGFGYRQFRIPTPYLWSFCQHHTKGKYVRDHVFDPNAPSKQIGAAVLLKQLQQDGVITI
jgi:lysozyme family protein